MAVGALSAAVVVPMLLHHVDTHSMMFAFGAGVKPVEQLGLGIVAGTVGSMVPDMDQKDALLTRRVEWVGKLVILCIAVVLIVLSGLTKSLEAWGIAAVLLAIVMSRNEWMRKGSLVVMALIVMGFGVMYPEWFKPDVLITIWLVVTAFSAHRTFTHSLLGLILLSWAEVFIGMKLHQVWVGETFILGYVLHLFADAIAGGVPLMWPYPKRFGVALVKTAGMFDRMISVLCVVLLIGVILG